tara:strand:+ start:443 stop:745 length:303 start_codon:yes stop_codon:yes gene_type:complete
MSNDLSFFDSNGWVWDEVLKVGSEIKMSNDEFTEDFDKADMILAEALEKFQSANVNPYIYGTALLEIGVAAMIKVGELEKEIVDTVKQLDAKIRPRMIEK